MTFHATPLGLLLVSSMAAHLVAVVPLAIRRRLFGHAAFASGMGLAAAAFVGRWIEVRHVPMPHLFEVCLSMGVMVYPLSLFCRRFLDTAGEAVDAFLAAVILFPTAFVFSHDPQHLPPALQSPLFIPHVTAYLLAYVLMAKAAVQAVWVLASREPAIREPAAYRVTAFGFPLLTLGLILGAWWGQLAWGDYWHWDPKELSSLASWLIYLAYFHLRFRLGGRYPRLGAVLLIGGFVAIVITFLWVNFARIFASLHSYA